MQIFTSSFKQKIIGKGLFPKHEPIKIRFDTVLHSYSLYNRVTAQIHTYANKHTDIKFSTTNLYS